MDNLTPEQRKKSMRNIRSKNTKIELALRNYLWHKGIRYRVNDKSVIGKPDICIKKYKLAVFCDSDFWHGKLYKEGKAIPKSNQDYWIPKLKKNIQRDIFVSEELEKDGWTVFRFWESDLKKNVSSCGDTIIDYIKSMPHND